jgi:hypothetical protein
MYWWRVRRTDRRWRLRIALSLLGLVVTGGILTLTTVEKFAEGGFMTVLITGIVIGLCFLNHAHYAKINASCVRPTRRCHPSTRRPLPAGA